MGKIGNWKCEKPNMEQTKNILLKCIIISLSSVHKLSIYNLESGNLLMALKINTDFGEVDNIFDFSSL